MTEMSIKQHLPSHPAPWTPLEHTRVPVPSFGSPLPSERPKLSQKLQGQPWRGSLNQHWTPGSLPRAISKLLLLQGSDPAHWASCVLFRLTKHLHLFYSITPWGLTAAASLLALLHPGTCPRSVEASGKLPLASINPWLNRGCKASVIPEGWKM